MKGMKNIELDRNLNRFSNDIKILSRMQEIAVVEIFEDYASQSGKELLREEKLKRDYRINADCIIWKKKPHLEGTVIEIKLNSISISAVLKNIIENFNEIARGNSEIKNFIIVSLNNYTKSTSSRFASIIKNQKLNIEFMMLSDFIKFANTYSSKEKVDEILKRQNEINTIKKNKELYSNKNIDRTNNNSVNNADIMLNDENIKTTFKLKNNIKCSVEGCNHISEYATFFVKEYKYGAISYDVDDTCPYLCLKHMKENEESSSGNRKAETVVHYKFTNKNNQIGYTKYFKLEIKFGLKMLQEHCKNDYIDISQDVESFVNLIVSEELSLPLTIGVFGGWGSGKTFFTNSLVEKIKNNSNDTCLVIPFNAWNYYDSNITVNLVYTILDNINNKIQKVADKNGKSNEFLKQLNQYKKLLKEDKLNDINSINAKIEEQENSLKKKKKEVIKQIADSIVSATGAQDEVDKIRDSCININDSVKDIKKEFDKIVSIYSFIKQNLKRIIITSIIAILVAVVAYVVIRSEILSAISMFTVSIGTNIGKIKKIINKIKNKSIYKKIFYEYISSFEDVVNIETKIKELKCEKSNKEEELNKLENNNITINFLREYIIKKLYTNGYKDNIGFINTVKGDMDDLKNIINTKAIKDIKDSPINLNKIILIVDDLDRCPENKVVEVLQAIQLLLSTEMFIVILAVDSKWVNKSIESVYSGMINNKNLEKEEINYFAINYLEKIIHIPFWIESLNKGNSSLFIKKLGEEITALNVKSELSIDFNEPVTTEQDQGPVNMEEKEFNEDKEKYTHNKDFDIESKEIEKDDFMPISLTDNDINLISEIDFLFDNTSPRKIKRFFNTVLLIKYKYYKNEKEYKKLLIGAASIILKANVFCEFYKYLFESNIQKGSENALTSIDYIIQSKKYANMYINGKLLSRYRDYIKDNFKEITMEQFEIIIYEASKYTYYQGEIFSYRL